MFSYLLHTIFKNLLIIIGVHITKPLQLKNVIFLVIYIIISKYWKKDASYNIKIRVFM